MKYTKLASTTFLIIFLFSCSTKEENTNTKPVEKIFSDYSQLVSFFHEWRGFEKPPLKNGAPDYTKATFDSRWAEFQNLRQKLHAFDTTGWSIENKVDWQIVNAEMNGFDFNYNILKPWERDPAFYKSFWTYKSDVPAHEGPTHHMTTEIWTYEFPLSKEASNKLLNELRIILPLNEQAKNNLTGNAKDLWIAGIRDIKNQSVELSELLEKDGIQENKDLTDAINQAISSTNELAKWLENEAVKKTGPSGIGKENYTWYQQNVHLVPLTWDDEVMLLKRELARAWSSLKLEEHRNRNLPKIKAANTKEEFDKLSQESIDSFLAFLEKDSIVSVKEYFKPALEAERIEFMPAEKRNFFLIGAHYDPRPLYTHFYHWFELARMINEPNKSEIRRGPLLYNIFDSRNEGTATAVEEMFMDAGMYDDNPRVREIVYIMIAQRAARGLGSLYAHANMMTMEEAGKVHSEYTPRGWMKTEKELLIFEQHLYLRQPGYGTSYITGKYLLEDALMKYARNLELKGIEFKLLDFFDRLNSIGNIPISLGSEELTKD